LVDSLVDLGHQTKVRSSIGHVNAIMLNNKTIDLGADKRGDNAGQLSK
jgi:gamma-glutamyltranspeptidase